MWDIEPAGFDGVYRPGPVTWPYLGRSGNNVVQPGRAGNDLVPGVGSNLNLGRSGNDVVHTGRSGNDVVHCSDNE